MIDALFDVTLTSLEWRPCVILSHSDRSDAVRFIGSLVGLDADDMVEILLSE